jgi:hypothetical protein
MGIYAENVNEKILWKRLREIGVARVGPRQAGAEATCECSASSAGPSISSVARLFWRLDKSPINVYLPGRISLVSHLNKSENDMDIERESQRRKIRQPRTGPCH